VCKKPHTPHACRFVGPTRPPSPCRAAVLRSVSPLSCALTGLSASRGHNALLCAHFRMWSARHAASCRAKARARITRRYVHGPPAHPCACQRGSASMRCIASASCTRAAALCASARHPWLAASLLRGAIARGLVLASSESPMPRAGMPTAVIDQKQRPKLAAAPPPRAAAQPLGNCSCVALPPASMQSCAVGADREHALRLSGRSKRKLAP